MIYSMSGILPSAIILALSKIWMPTYEVPPSIVDHHWTEGVI
jgi:hypothetical protein